MSSKSSTMKIGGKHNRKHRNTRRVHSVTNSNILLFRPSIKVKQFGNIKQRRLPKKGIVYSIEKPEVISRDNTIEGDIIKKYVDGKLVDQKFITKNKMLEMSQTYNKIIKGGAVAQVPQQNVEIKQAPPTVVQVQDNTSFAQSFRTGIAFGLAFEFIDRIFGE